MIVIELKKDMAALEYTVCNEPGPLQTLYSVCSGCDNKPAADALSNNLVNFFARLAAVEHHCVAAATQPSISLGSRPVPPLPSSRDTELDTCKVQLSLFASRLDDLKACMRQESVKMSGVKLESLLHTTSWIKNEVPCSSYHIFNDHVTLLSYL